MGNTINVTKAVLPSIEEYIDEISSLWETHWLTNMGVKHQELQRQLIQYLDINNVDLLTNGHMALELTLQAMNLQGEVITTPFTFASTTHAIVRNNLEPVFCDIKADDFTIDPDKIENLITDRTCAIMPVDVYGNVCNVEAIDRIAKKYELKVIYDDAHAFGVKYKGRGIGNYGDASCFSFHATKVFNTIEGGALVVHDEKMKKRIDNLKNFGITDEVTVVAPGINGKMDEMRSAYGLLNLKQVDKAIENRRAVAKTYRDVLRNTSGVLFRDDMPGVRHNYSYFPIFINAEEFGMTRDELYYKMMEQNVWSRRYFYPLISNFPTYRGLPSSNKENLPVGNKIADEVLCLPMHHALTEEELERILSFFQRQ